MLTKRSIVIALASALALGATGTALATPINVGGVVWDPSSPLDLTVHAQDFRETSVANVGDVLHGYGAIGSINGTDQSTFCPGCDLTFTFSYTVRSLGTGGSGNPQAVFDMGSINFYVDNTSSFNVLDPTTAGVGTLWLSLTGHTAPFTGFVDTGGQLYANINGTVSDPTGGSNGIGLADVAGGVAGGFFNTNTINDGIGGFADFNLNSSFLEKPATGCGSMPTTNLDLLCSYPITGTAELTGSSRIAVPEPGEMGLLGLGLAVLGFFIQRRRKGTDGQA
jgi:hypothetical protein